jgi:hypothetical protein
LHSDEYLNVPGPLFGLDYEFLFNAITLKSEINS